MKQNGAVLRHNLGVSSKTVKELSTELKRKLHIMSSDHSPGVSVKKTDELSTELKRKLDLMPSDMGINVMQNGAVLGQNLGVSSKKAEELCMELKRKLDIVSSDDVGWESEFDSVPRIGDYDFLLRESKRKRSDNDDCLVDEWIGTGDKKNSVLLLSSSLSEPVGYVADPDMSISTSDDISDDVEKARSLVKSLIGTGKENRPAVWIAAARLEEVAGNLECARKLILRGCKVCGGSEDKGILRWEESRLAGGNVSIVPDSIELWMMELGLEKVGPYQSRVVRARLYRDPCRIWKVVVEIARDGHARSLLRLALSNDLSCVELWLGLARLGNYKHGLSILYLETFKSPCQPAISIAAARLAEANGYKALAGNIIERAFMLLKRGGVGIDREVWMREAENAESAGSVATGQVIRFRLEKELLL